MLHKWLFSFLILSTLVVSIQALQEGAACTIKEKTYITSGEEKIEGFAEIQGTIKNGVCVPVNNPTRPK